MEKEGKVVRRCIDWFPDDWLADTGLRLCSLSARGLWIDMLAIMHKAAPYGHLAINGNPMTIAELACAVGAQEPDVEAAFGELARRQVFSRTPDGLVFSRRLLRDIEKRRMYIEAGKRGGNPNLVERPRAAAGRPGSSGVPPAPAASSTAPAPRSKTRPPKSAITPETKIVVELWNSLGRNPRDRTGGLERTHRSIRRHLDKYGEKKVAVAVERLHEDFDNPEKTPFIANAFGERDWISPYYAEDWEAPRQREETAEELYPNWSEDENEARP